jgi:hypothetical protein
MLDFASVEAFDRHKTGVHAYTFAEGMAMRPPREDGRRCLDVEELANYAGKGGVFAQDARGQWGQPARSSRARQAFLGVTPSAQPR